MKRWAARQHGPVIEGVRREMDAQAARVFALFASLAVGAAAPLLQLYGGISDTVRVAMQATLLGLALALLALYFMASRGYARLAVVGALVAGVIGNTMLAGAMGVGVQGQSLGLFALMVALAGVLLGMRAALALAALCGLAVLLLYQAEMQGFIGGRALAAAMPAANRAYTLGVLIVIGLVAALAMSRLYLRAFEDAALQRERLRGLLHIGTDWIWEQDAEGRFTHVSESFTRRTGIEASRLIGQTLWTLPGLQMPEHESQPLRDAYAAARPLRDALLPLLAADGRRLLIELNADPCHDEQGRLIGWRGVGHDVTRLADESQRRHESEQLLLRVFNTSPDAVAVTSLYEGRIEMVNETFAQTFGLDPATAIGRDTLSLGIWRDPAERVALRERVLREGRVHNQPVHMRAAGGRDLLALMSASRLPLNGREHMVAILRDISELERERADNSVLLQHAAVGLALVRDDVFLRVNAMYETLLGFGVGTLAGQPTRVVFYSDQAYERFRARAVTGILGGGIDIETTIRRRDGQTFPGRMRGRAIDPLEPYAAGIIWVLEDISERQRAQRQLAEAKEQAEAANQAKSAFLASMSHEMRTPLNGVLGMIRLALGEPLQSPQRDVYLRHAEASGQALAQIISDVLDLSRVEAGRLQLEQTEFDLYALAEGLIALHAPQAETQGLQLALNIAPEVPRSVLGDAARVRQVIVNFLANALKFTEIGRVDLRLETVSADAACTSVKLTVRDTGIGIPQDVQQHLFQPFVQADSSTTRRFGGTGLGLSICRELVQLMGGRIGLHSRPGEGSSFWAELPLARVGEAPAPAAAPSALAAGNPLQGLRVLVAEDHPVNMLIAVEMLKRWGAEVDEAQDGVAALDQVQQAEAQGWRHDAVLMDMHMPLLGGLETTRRLRERLDPQQLPIIALTAAALASEQRQALDAGMNDFVSKPIDAAQLLQALLKAARAGSYES